MQIDQDSEEWLYSIGSQSVHGFFSEEDNQESTRIEDSAPYGAILINQDPEGVRYTMLVVKWSDNVEGYGENIDSPLCSGLYKEENDSLVTWSGTDTDANMNSFTSSKEDNDWIVLGDQYNEEFKKWRGPIHNGQFRSQNLKEKRNIEETCYKYS